VKEATMARVAVEMPAFKEATPEVNVNIRRAVDEEETGRRWIYIVVEVSVYLFFPLIVGCVLALFFPSQLALCTLAGLVFLLWPFLKGKAGVIVARRRKLVDPRHGIQSSSFWYDGFMFIGSPALRQIRKYSALSKSLDMIYNYFGRFGIMPEGMSEDWWRKLTPIQPVNWLVRAWTSFWIGMPIAQDVRSRLNIVAEEFARQVTKKYDDLQLTGNTRPVRVVVLAGGTLQDIIIGVSKAMERCPGIRLEVVSVEPDGLFSVKRFRKLLKFYGVPAEFFQCIMKKVSTNPEKQSTLREVVERAGHSLYDFDLVICIGLGDYMYGKKIYDFVRMLDNGGKIITANITDNFVERFFLHIFIQWPKMQYLGLAQYLQVLDSTLGSDRKVSIIQTPHGIFNIAVIE
jgi:hypothetical protein